MATFIHGIGASENIDSSGEIVSIAGLDISSLDKDGVFNYEHKSDLPAQVVGKILKARKIFSDADCEDDNQLMFWNKVKVPYLYVMGELLDDYSDSAREVAARFKYDQDHKNQNERSMMNFSVEGSKISKEGITVSRSIARKITITILPCNKAAVAEMIAVDPSKPKKAEIDELFKTETTEIQVLVPTEGSSLWNLLKKEDPNRHAAKLGIKAMKKDYGGGQISAGASSGLSGTGPTSAGGILAESEMKKAAPKLALAGAKPANHARGTQIGLTSAGHAVHSHGMVGDYSHFSHKDHSEAAAAHQRVSDASKDPKAKMHHAQKAKLHGVRSSNMQVQGQARQERADKLKTTTSAPTGSPTGQGQKLFHPGLSGTGKPPGPQKKSEMNKALDAGSALASPANLSGGAALGKEELDKNIAATMDGEENVLVKDAANIKLAPKDVKVKQLQQQIDTGKYKQPSGKQIADKMVNHPEKPLKKSARLMQAEHAYQNWEKREAFETFMGQRMPHLTKTEIKIIGQTMLLTKSIEMEKSLKRMAKDFYNPGTLRGSEKIK
jgi:hypothetical protein